MMTCPGTDQYVAVSTTVRPVTHTALVAVNSAVTNGAPPSPVRERGSMSSTEPAAPAAAKAKATTWAGCRKTGLRREREGA